MKVIPYGHQWIVEEDIKQVLRVLRSNWITQGPKIEGLEDALCKYTGARYAVVVSSGTAALHIACLAAGIKRGDEIITSPITFAASTNCILYCGGKPIFVDIQQDTVNINPEEIKKKLNKRTKAIICVHFAGHSCDLKEIYQIAKKYDLLLIEDAAHALGAKYRGSNIGSCRYSDMTIFSFHPIKTITTGEGGAVLTNDKVYYKKLMMLRNHGITKRDFIYNPEGGWYYEMQLLGYNYRITDFQAALGMSQLKRVDRFIEERRKIAEIYNKAFKDNSFFEIPIEKGYVYSSYHLYPIRLKDEYKHKKKMIFSELTKRGLGVQVHYMPIYFHPYYRRLGYVKGICPFAEDFYQRTVTLPLYPSMKDAEVKFVEKTLNSVLKDLDRICL